MTLSRSSVEPFLQFSARRDLREKAFRAWIARGDNGGKTDNKPVIAELTALRDERARLLGYPSFAHYKLDDTMAKTPDAVTGLLDAVWAPARRRVGEERDALQDMVAAEGGNFALAPWDWRYYAEKLRKARYDLDESEIKPYLPLDSIIEAAFYTANRLFGLTFKPRSDVPVYHPDVRVWEVSAADGRHIGVFFGDYFARPSKRSGAWMTSLRDQEKLDGEIRPLVLNVMNFNKGANGEPTLLSFDDARTLFHEFGHGLHGLMSDVTYPMISGTGVLQDFVELPSQLYEHWLDRPEILTRFARHYKTGEADAEGADGAPDRVAHLQSGLRDQRISRLVLRRTSISTSAARRTRTRSRRRRASACRCRRRSCCATARRTSSTSSRATTTRPATTAICGPRCSTPTPSRRSRRRATCSIRRRRSACAITSTRRAARAIRRRPIGRSAAACRRSMRCSRSAGSRVPDRP